MYINGLKYACSTCIKGHRSSSCSHVDRPLFEIRKKGRPVSQCNYCRDLRKTKQVHIKCACNSKKGDQQQPVLIYRNNNNNSNNTSPTCSVHNNDDVIQSKQCICPANNSTPMIRSSSATQPYLSLNVSQEITRESVMSAPLCTTSLVKKEEAPSYSWALVTSPPTNHADLSYASNSSTTTTITPVNEEPSNFHLGFIFHKPSNASRILDGQPKIHKRRSVKKSPASTPIRNLPTNVNYDTIMNTDSLTGLSTPHSTVSSQGPMDMQFDYLTQQLEVLSNHKHTQDLMGEDLTNTEELTAILNNVFQKEDGQSSIKAMLQDDQMLSNVSHTVPSLPEIPLTTMPTPIPQPSPVGAPNVNRSHCGSFVPSSQCCKPVGSSGGESVVITITPLVAPNKQDQQRQHQQQQQNQHSTTTRIVTCYCGNQCTCPGCLVHPGNFFLGSDPYSGPLINPSSSASSSCYGSDDEDIASIYSNHNNVNFTF
ncbi:hypothetical protein G6F46_005371 [Rhizopus delemar]|nr:hypothetical protein G6F55_004004 [Rhizopus delemar]KAG1546282.1 hypothetical protein G6F51_004968 [Rhizopus arrhizus]KAG1499001.1 hypothetical protein G6F54_004691 [Rhizopus delemar]KAG1512749.1 hypothetical protein G6F53_004948 [Rhizopus delemar]KAG1570860.1 hypothetical protein G6F50_005116 [Rhizopus delemar]